MNTQKTCVGVYDNTFIYKHDRVWRVRLPFFGAQWDTLELTALMTSLHHVFYTTFIIPQFGFEGGGQFTLCLSDLRHIRNPPPGFDFMVKEDTFFVV